MESFEAVRLASAGCAGTGYFVVVSSLVCILYNLRLAAANLNTWSSFVFRHIFVSPVALRNGDGQKWLL